jgi:hypothetical protein
VAWLDWLPGYEGQIYLRTMGPGLYHPGDANCDGVIDAADAVTVANHVQGLRTIADPVAADNADLDADGRIETVDRDAIIDDLLGLN